MAMMMRAFRGTRVLRAAAAAGPPAKTGGAPPPAGPAKGGPPSLTPPDDLDDPLRKEFYWGGIDDFIESEEGKKELNKLRVTIKQVTAEINSKFVFERRKPKWDHFRKDLGSGIVDLFEKSLDSLEYPKYDDPTPAKIKEKFAELEMLSQELDEDLKKRSEKMKFEMERMRQVQERLPTITVNEVLKIYPEWEEEIEEELRQLKWEA